MLSSADSQQSVSIHTHKMIVFSRCSCVAASSYAVSRQWTRRAPVFTWMCIFLLWPHASNTSNLDHANYQHHITIYSYVSNAFAQCHMSCWLQGRLCLLRNFPCSCLITGALSTCVVWLGFHSKLNLWVFPQIGYNQVITLFSEEWLRLCTTILLIAWCRGIKMHIYSQTLNLWN